MRPKGWVTVFFFLAGVNAAGAVHCLRESAFSLAALGALLGVATMLFGQYELSKLEEGR